MTHIIRQGPGSYFAGFEDGMPTLVRFITTIRSKDEAELLATKIRQFTDVEVIPITDLLKDSSLTPEEHFLIRIHHGDEREVTDADGNVWERVDGEFEDEVPEMIDVELRAQLRKAREKRLRRKRRGV